MTRRAENINPTILKWARETAGMSLEDAAARLGFTSRAKRASAARLEALERGESKPTRNQLLKIAATYRRPLTAFYRTAPPVPGNRGEDFRSIGGVTDKSEPLLDALLRATRVRQDMVRSLLEDDEDIESLTFVGSLPITMPIEDAARTIRIALRIDEAARRELPRQPSNSLLSENGLKRLVSSCCWLGILVPTTPISMSACFEDLQLLIGLHHSSSSMTRMQRRPSRLR